MKKIMISLGVMVAVAAGVMAGTNALFNDTETSTGNIFTAGSIDLKVDHAKASYNGNDCLGTCEEVGTDLIINGGFEIPALSPGSWQVFPDATQTSWDVESGAGLEIQNNAAGAPHGGQQLAELDSNNSSAISQTLTTVPGAKYRLTFWYSPRPNRPAGDNTIGVVVKVVSDNTLLVSDTIGATSSGGSNTNWSVHTYAFTALDATTKIMFTDLGTNNSYGGYLDDISMYELDCSYEIVGGTCTLWEEKDLTEGDYFWWFDDVKPGDYGKNLISLHAFSNDAYMCWFVDGTDKENTWTEPEQDAGDPGTPSGLDGELSKYLKVFAWADDGDGIYQNTETILAPVNSLLDTEIIQMSLQASHIEWLGLAWCAGTQSLTGPNSDIITCTGVGNQDDAQTDSYEAIVTAYAVQQRNNANFSCDDEFGNQE